VGDAPSLETFKARLDGALSNLGWLKMSLLIAGGLDWMALKGPFPPKPFHDSLILRKAEIAAQVGAHAWKKKQI